MIADYYSQGFDEEHIYGQEVLVHPNTTLFIPIDGNLRAIIEAERIKASRKAWIAVSNQDRTPPALFWDEILVASDKGSFVFETRYITDSDDVLPISYMNQIPERLRKEFLSDVPEGIHQLAKSLIGNERETRRILHRFYEFVHEHEKPEHHTIGKPIEQLLEEYSEKGFFYGNCKESRIFYVSLCNAIGYPTKRVEGKALSIGGHVWTDVFVPMERGYGLIPADATLENFGHHNRRNHLLFEKSPEMPINRISRLKNWVKGKDNPKEYKLKIERIN